MLTYQYQYIQTNTMEKINTQKYKENLILFYFIPSKTSILYKELGSFVIHL